MSDLFYINSSMTGAPAGSGTQMLKKILSNERDNIVFDAKTGDKLTFNKGFVGHELAQYSFFDTAGNEVISELEYIDKNNVLIKKDISSLNSDFQMRLPLAKGWTVDSVDNTTWTARNGSSEMRFNSTSVDFYISNNLITSNKRLSVINMAETIMYSTDIAVTLLELQGELGGTATAGMIIDRNASTVWSGGNTILSNSFFSMTHDGQKSTPQMITGLDFTGSAAFNSLTAAPAFIAGLPSSRLYDLTSCNKFTSKSVEKHGDVIVITISTRQKAVIKR